MPRDLFRVPVPVVASYCDGLERRHVYVAVGVPESADCVLLSGSRESLAFDRYDVEKLVSALQGAQRMLHHG